MIARDLEAIGNIDWPRFVDTLEPPCRGYPRFSCRVADVEGVRVTVMVDRSDGSMLFRVETDEWDDECCDTDLAGMPAAVAARLAGLETTGTGTGTGTASDTD